MQRDLPDTSFADIAIALLIEAQGYASNNGQLEILTHKMCIAGLNETVAARIYQDKLRQAAAAHKLFKATVEHEAAIRRIIAPPLSVVDKGEVA
jgi:hypothetical protein